MEFDTERPVPTTDKEALVECVEVLERIMRDNLLCGAGSCRLNTEDKVELPLYGCARRALEHAKLRMANDQAH